MSKNTFLNLTEHISGIKLYMHCLLDQNDISTEWEIVYSRNFKKFYHQTRDENRFMCPLVRSTIIRSAIYIFGKWPRKQVSDRKVDPGEQCI